MVPGWACSAVACIDGLSGEDRRGPLMSNGLLGITWNLQVKAVDYTCKHHAFYEPVWDKVTAIGDLGCSRHCAKGQAG